MFRTITGSGYVMFRRPAKFRSVGLLHRSLAKSSVSFFVRAALWVLVVSVALCPLAYAEDTVKEKSAMDGFGFVEPDDRLRQQEWYQKDQKARELLDQGNILEAERVWIEASKLSEQSSQVEPGFVNCLVGLSLLYHKKGDPKESERVYEYAMRNMEGLVGRGSIRFARFLPDLAWLYHAHGRKDQAEILFKQHLSMHEKEYGTYAPEILESLDHYSRYLHKTGRHSEANSLETRAQSIKDKAKP